jgi:hypothetical protein
LSKASTVVLAPAGKNDLTRQLPEMFAVPIFAMAAFAAAMLGYGPGSPAFAGTASYT